MATVLAGAAFEAVIGARFRALGWAVETTPASGDYGADLVVELGPEKLVIQCKDYGAPVGLCAVQEVHLARSMHRATAAIVVARNGFTRAAKHGAVNAGVVLLQPDQIGSGCAWDRTKDADAARRKADLAKRNNAEAARQSADAVKRDMDEKGEVIGRELRRHQDKRLDRIGAIIGRELSYRSRKAKKPELQDFEHSLAWRVYDTALDEFRTQCRKSHWLGIGAALRLCGPSRPSANRRGALIKCGICSQRLRVDYGRTGQILCPRCKTYISAQT